MWPYPIHAILSEFLILPNNFLFAGAGTGKTERVVNESIDLIREGKRVLVLTYTTSNQREIHDRFVLKNRKADQAFAVKGLFTFYLEEMIRPYQRAIFPDRICKFHFNDNDPHKANGRTIPGRSEKINGKYNSIYYLTKDRAAAHSTYLAKLACAINKEARGAPIRRLEKIYDHIFFDECQDLVGWDYELLAMLSKCKSMSITCVGDFRQTIYETAVTNKKPGTIAEKLAHLKKLGFNEEYMNESYRSVQSICDFAAKIHESEKFLPMMSAVIAPAGESHHVGVFVVKESNAREYIEQFHPVLLRHSVTSGTAYDDMPMKRITFGKSKGLGFPRTIIIPTDSHLKFLQGNTKAFDQGKTEAPKNKCYVAFTRAQFSVAIIVPDKLVAKCNATTWMPA
jgi:DNA helicase-2/ATP-dependent DNA helicase PcrA